MNKLHTSQKQARSVRMNIPVRFSLSMLFAVAASIIGLSGVAKPSLDQLVEQRRYSDVVVECTKSIEQNSKDAEAYFLRAWSNGYLNNYREALQDYNAALQLHPTSIAYGNRAWVNIHLKRYQEAIADCNLALKIKPNYAYAFEQRGAANLQIGENQNALSDLDLAVKFDANHSQARALRGEVRRRNGKYVSALADFQRAMMLDPKLSGLKINCAYCDISLGFFGPAIDFCNSVMSKPKHKSRALIARGEAYCRQGMLTQALDDYSQALVVNPESFSAYGGRAYVYSLLSEYDKSMADYARALQVTPSDNQGYKAILYKYRAEGYASHGHWENAVSDYRNALAIKPDLWTYHGLAETYHNLGRHDDELTACNEAVKLAPEAKETYYDRTFPECCLGLYRRSIHDSNKAISLDPKDPWPYFRRGYAEGERGNYQNCVEDCTKSLELYTSFGPAPKPIVICKTRAHAYMMLGEFGNALVDYLAVVSQYHVDYQIPICLSAGLLSVAAWLMLAFKSRSPIKISIL